MTVDRPRIPGWPGLRTAREIAAATGARTVGTQHLLLALVRRQDGCAAVLHGVDESAVRAALRGIVGTGGRTEAVPAERVSVSPRALAVIREAARRHPASSGTVPDLHVLGALLDGDEPSLARLALTSLGTLGRTLRAYRDVAVGGRMAPSERPQNRPNALF